MMSTRTTRSASEALLPILPKHITDVNLHVYKRTRHGAIYSKEIELLKLIQNEDINDPVIQMTPQLAESAEAVVDNDDELGEAEEEIDERQCRAKSFYYRGSCKSDVKSHHRKRRSVICRCPRWHLIESPRMYWLVDRQFTLFEILKGNQKDEAAGFVTEGHFFNASGMLICKTSYDLVRDEYSIKPLVDFIWE